MNTILELDQQVELMDKMLKNRLTMTLPHLMKETGIDAWIVSCREYNEDPVFDSLTPALFINARRLTILLFIYQEGKVHCLNCGRPDPFLNRYYKQVYQPAEEEQYEAVLKQLEIYRPKKIGINISTTFAFGDGLSSSLHQALVKALGSMSERLVSSEDLCIRWLETRSQEQIKLYPSIMDKAMKIIQRAFSKEVIIPGVTTTSDVEWFMMKENYRQGLYTWFHPTVDLQRTNREGSLDEELILPGDLLHCDYGIRYLGLCTDTQRLAYVLKEDEVELPQGLAEGFKENNHFQDIVCENFVAGRSGNEILKASLDQAQKEKIMATLYSHPIGTHGHGAGPTIGLWDQQGGVRGQGDYLLFDHTCYALELNTKRFVKEWNTEVCFMSEETVCFNNKKVHYLAENRDKIILI